jgi:uncharacterized membrane protein
MDETDLAHTPVVVYGVNLLMAGIAYYLLQLAILRLPGSAAFRRALGRDLKGKSSPVIYSAGIALSFVSTWLAIACYVAVALMWLVPDRRVERFLSAEAPDPAG